MQTATPKPEEQLTWKQRYKRMKTYYNWTDKDVSNISGHSPLSVRQMVNEKQHDFPRWLRVAIVVFEKENPLFEKSKPVNF